MTAATDWDDLDVTDLDSDDAAPRWEPDQNLVTVTLASPATPFKLTDLPWLDRCWLVAGLHEDAIGEAGLTAQEIADRTHCSLRLVRDILSKDLTQGFRVAHKLNAKLTKELSASRSEHALTRRDLAEKATAEEQAKAKFDQLIDALTKTKSDKQGKPVKLCSKKHPVVGYNKYRYTDRNGRTREICRECNRDRVARCRAKQRQSPEQPGNAAALQNLHQTSIASAP